MQDDAAFKQKQREEKKKMAEAQAKASQKGPMGEYLGQRDNYFNPARVSISSFWLTLLCFSHPQAEEESRRVERNESTFAT